MSVAREPNTTSQMAHPVKRFASTQPTASPGTAAAVKTGRMVSASDSLTWITPLASPARLAIKVKTTYRAAIIAPCVKSSNRIEFFLFIIVRFLYMIFI